MQETCNNCFGSKIRSTIIRKAKTGKHECRNVSATTFFQPETIVASFLHHIVLLLKVLLNHSSKRQFSVLYCLISSLTNFLVTVCLFTIHASLLAKMQNSEAYTSA